MQEIKISIIIPSYNQGEYIEETIQSILKQTYKNIELIIVDGNSTDNTQKILNKYKSMKNIKIIIEPDKGQSDAINKGFKIAKGELVGWVNSDDLLDKDCVEKVIEVYKNNPDVAIICGNIMLIDSKGNNIKEVKANSISYEYLLNNNPDVNQQGSFYNADLLKKVGYLDENIHYTMDYDLWLRLLKEEDSIIIINDILSSFRLHNQSKTSGGGTFFKFWNNIFQIRKEKHGCRGIKKIHFVYSYRIIKAIFRKVLNKNI